MSGLLLQNVFETTSLLPDASRPWDFLSRLAAYQVSNNHKVAAVEAHRTVNGRFSIHCCYCIQQYVQTGSTANDKIPVAVVENQNRVVDVRQVTSVATCVINLMKIEPIDVFRTMHWNVPKILKLVQAF